MRPRINLALLTALVLATAACVDTPRATLSRRARAREIRARTGWAFARCRETVDRSDAEIDAIVESEKPGVGARGEMFSCAECGGDVFEKSDTGHEVDGCVVPTDMTMPTCSKCGEVYYSAGFFDELRRRGLLPKIAEEKRR